LIVLAEGSALVSFRHLNKSQWIHMQLHLINHWVSD